MTRRDWWLGITVIVLALLVHAAIPRFEIIPVFEGAGAGGFVRVDRWSGRAELAFRGNIARVTWLSVR